MWKGMKTRLTIEELDHVPLENTAIEARQPLLEALKSVPKGKNSRLMRATLRAFGPSFLIPVLPRTILLLATFVQPLLVNKMVHLVTDSSVPTSHGWYLVGAFVADYRYARLSFLP
jgi:ATP-binding cassette, subfamily C (CFTR/MRP), member 1